MRVAPKKGDCVVCQAPDAIRTAVNAAIWHEGSVVRVANYRAAGARAASQIAMTLGPEADRYSELDPKTITRHADHIEDAWRDVMAGERLADDEVPISHEFGDVMDAGAELAMMSMGGLRDLVRQDPVAFAALRTKEAIALAKVGIVAAGAKETSRIKRNQQKIDVVAIFASSAGFMPRGEVATNEAVVTVDALRSEVAAERKLLETGT